MGINTKGVLQSTTILSNAVGTITSAILLLQQLTEVIQLVEPSILAATTVITSIIGIFGRLKATTKISGLIK
jgi:hypothetical protein